MEGKKNDKKKIKVMLYIDKDLVDWVKSNVCGEGVTFQEAVRRMLANMKNLQN